MSHVSLLLGQPFSLRNASFLDMEVSDEKTEDLVDAPLCDFAEDLEICLNMNIRKEEATSQEIRLGSSAEKAATATLQGTFFTRDLSY